MRINTISFENSQYDKDENALNKIVNMYIDKIKDCIYISVLDREPRKFMAFRTGRIYGAEAFSKKNKKVAGGYLRCVYAEPYKNGCYYTFSGKYSEFNKSDWKKDNLTLIEKITRRLF